ncbi:unnamed protein product, partial [Musa acuminata subsp. burmannicoides]
MMHAIANPSFPVKMSSSPTNEVMASDDFHILPKPSTVTVLSIILEVPLHHKLKKLKASHSDEHTPNSPLCHCDSKTNSNMLVDWYSRVTRVE